MRGPAITLRPETSLQEIHEVMIENAIHGVPVVDAQGRAVGMVTSTDLLTYGLDVDEAEQTRPAAVDYLARLLEYSPDEARDLTHAVGDRFAGRTIADVMTEDVVTVDVDAPIREAAEEMSRNQIHRIVATEHGRVCGIVSSLDLVALLASES
jgi:CBS domain-containing protein